jgi:hypothetical protein
MENLKNHLNLHSQKTSSLLSHTIVKDRSRSIEVILFNFFHFKSNTDVLLQCGLQTHTG